MIDYDKRMRKLLKKHSVTMLPQNIIKSMFYVYKRAFSIINEELSKDPDKTLICGYVEDVEAFQNLFQYKMQTFVFKRNVSLYDENFKSEDFAEYEKIIIVSTDRERLLFRGIELVTNNAQRIININSLVHKEGVLLTSDLWKYKSSPLKSYFKQFVYLCYYLFPLFWSTKLISLAHICNMNTLDIYYYRKMWLRCLENEKDYYSKMMLVSYLDIRDFKGAISLLEDNDYLRMTYSGLREHIEKLLREIYTRMSNKKKDAVILYWIDSIPYKEYTENVFFEYIKNKNGMEFSNAYTVIPWTHWTLYTMFCQKYPIEDKMYDMGQLNEDNSTLLKYLKDQQYSFQYLGMDSFGKKYFEQQYNSTENSIQSGWGTVPLPRLLWQTTCSIVRDDQNVVVLIHELLETHSPFFSPECDDIHYFEHYAGYSTKQIECGSKYVIDQLRWYEKNLLSDRAINSVYFSDHGRFLYSNVDDIRVHIFFHCSPKKSGSEKKLEERFFSLYNFKYVMEYLIERKNDIEERAFPGFALIENIDFYAKKLINIVKKQKIPKELWMQSRGVYTEEGMYASYVDGSEKYVINPTSMNGANGDEEIKRKLQELTGDTFIDVFTVDKFSATRELYKENDN